jgi:hypothetical protein
LFCGDASYQGTQRAAYWASSCLASSAAASAGNGSSMSTVTMSLYCCRNCGIISLPRQDSGEIGASKDYPSQFPSDYNNFNSLHSIRIIAMLTFCIWYHAESLKQS